MDVLEQANQKELMNFLTPSLGLDGEWRSSGSLALQESLRLGSAAGVLEILGKMDARTTAACLREVGIYVPDDAVARGHDAILAEVQPDINAAIAAQIDGFGLARKRMPRQQALVAAKPVIEELNGTGFANAAQAIQRLMRVEHIDVQMFGQAKASERPSLLFVAGQALQKQVQGFAFEGIDGKYDVPISMPEMLDLHREAARAVGEESARTALGVWVTGGKVGPISEWVPDSVQKLLYGSVSVDSASSLVEAIKGGMVGRNAAAFGIHGFTALLAGQGLDVNAKTVAMQAADLGLDIVEPDRQRGQYVGPMVGSDHRAALVKFNRKSVLELPFAELAEGQEKPNVGDRIRMGFKNGALTVSVAPSVERTGMDR